MKYLIDFFDDAQPEEIAAYLAQSACTVVERYAGLGNIYLVECNEAPMSSPLIERSVEDSADSSIKLMDTVTFSEPAVETFPHSEDDAHWWKMAVLLDMDYEATETDYRRIGQGVRVYLLDSGIDATHPEFAGKDITLLHSFTGEYSDSNGHGTALASVITGKTCALTDAAIKVVKVFHNGQTTYMSDIVAALNAVAEDYLQDTSKTAVLNMSWIINANDYVESKIRNLYALGVIPVAAAGNHGGSVSDYSPARMPECITVGSFGQELTPSDFSNYTGQSGPSYTAGPTNHGPGLDLFAPGEMIRCAGSNGTIGWVAGTSVAAAIQTASIVSHLARIGGSYSFYKQRDMEDTFRSWTINNLLTLSGNYSQSPNRTSLMRIRPQDEVTNTYFGTIRSVVACGSEFAGLAFDATAYRSVELTGNPTGVVLKDNYITGTAPSQVTSTNGIDAYVMSMTMTTPNDTVHERDYILIVYDPAITQSTDETLIVEESGMALQCCPPFQATCCGPCNKTGCSSDCATGVGACP